MDCFDLPALGSESSSSAAASPSSSSASTHTQEDEIISNHTSSMLLAGGDHDMTEAVVDRDKLKKETKEKILNSYKEGLKLFGLGNLSQAEAIFQSILDDPFLKLVDEATNEEEEEEASTRQELNILKYVLYKNLSTIESAAANYSKALDYLIQAVKIDDTDRCVWYEIGQNALRLGKFLIARYSFEKSLSIDPHDWFSLDQLIVLLYSFGHYSLSLAYIFDALKLDKYYVTGLVLLKKLQHTDMTYYTKQIETFVDAHFTPHGIDINLCLSRIDAHVYDTLMSRIDWIKTKLRDQLVQISDTFDTSTVSQVKEIRVLEKINSWQSLGELVLKIDQSLDVSIKHSLKLIFESDQSMVVDEGVVVESTIETEKDKLTTLPAELLPSNKKSKRKIKFDQVVAAAGDDFSKRRSSRKFDKAEAQCGGDEDNMTICDIIKEYFDESYLNKIETKNNQFMSDNNNERKQSTNSNITPRLLLLTCVKQVETTEVVELCCRATSTLTTMFDIYKSFLKGVSRNYDKLWYGSLEELYVNIFHSLNRQFDLFEALEQETVDPAEFVTLVSILLTYMEIETSKVKEMHELAAKKKSAATKKQTINKTNSENESTAASSSSMSKIVFNLQELEFLIDKSSSFVSLNMMDEKLNRRNFLARVYSLLLYASLEFPDMSISSEYYEQKLFEIFTNDEEHQYQIIVANSKVFQIISRAEIEQLLKQSKKSNKLKLNDQIEKMFNEAKYEQVVAEFADFPEIHNLQLEDPNVNLDIYIHLLNSYLILNQLDKSDYFSRFYLKQIIKFMARRGATNKNNAPLSSSSSSSDVVVVSDSSSDLTLDASSSLFDEIKENERVRNLTGYVIQILDVLEKSIDFNTLASYSGTAGDSSNQSSGGESIGAATIKHDIVWIMSSLISIYYENSQQLVVAKANLMTTHRPVKAFFILYNLLLPSDLENRVAFLSSLHDYLAQSNLCSSNGGQFLAWTIRILVDYKSQCELCNSQSTTANQAVVESSSSCTNQDTELTSADKQNQQQQQTNTNKPRCLTCGEMDKLLDQSFYCLYGYKKRALRHLESHNVTRIAYTLADPCCISLYNYYKPSKLPEYDDLAKMSIPVEFYDFLCELHKLIIQQETVTTDNSSSSSSPLATIRNRFLLKLNKENFQSFDALLESISDNQIIETTTFKDMYFLMGDFNFKTTLTKENKDELVLNYLIKDLTINKNRRDAWTELALSTSAKILEDFPESGKHVNTRDDLVELLNSIYVCINLFTKAVENITTRQSGVTSIIEFALFLYQMHSYCSRQVKLNEIIHHFESDEIREKLCDKKIEFLRRSLELYKKADRLTKKPVKVIEDTKKLDEIQGEESSSSSASSSSSSTSLSSSTSTSKKKKAKSLKSGADELREVDENQDDNEEEWLYHYMLGKIKEKLGTDNYNLIECLQDYKLASDLLERNHPIILKRCTYKSRNCWYVELNEVYYRIYALTLKRVEAIMSDHDQMRLLSTFLEHLTESEFVSTHGDLRLEETSSMLQEYLFDQSQLIHSIPNRDLFINCVCICVAGLNQILRRFPQHYRSLYRLAHFYSNCLDFKSLEIAKNLLLSTNNSWQTLAYMPSPGLFAERNKTNFFNGIWRISTNTKDEQQDLERKGNFSSHLFQALKLTLKVLTATKDTSGLIDVSKAFYQKIDPDKQEKVYMDESYRAIVANMSLNCAYELSKETFESKNWFGGVSLDEKAVILNELLTLIMETFEIQKLVSKHLDSLSPQVNQLLIDVCSLVAQPDNSVSTLDQAIKYCQAVEKQVKQKPSKAPTSATAIKI